MLYFKYHNNLIPTLWGSDKKLKKLISNCLQIIAWSFLDYARNVCGLYPFIKDEDIKDIFIYGSITNYYYNNKSDIDMCILIDMTKLKDNLSAIDVNFLLKLMIRDWLHMYKPNIYGRDVDISVQDVNVFPHGLGKAYRSGSVFSVMKNEWISEPIKLHRQDIKNMYYEALPIYKDWVKQYKDIKKNKMEFAILETFFNQIHKEKNISHDFHILQPVTPTYIAFRMLRNRGIIRWTKKQSQYLRSKNFNLK